eukprot:TRINITY_DN67936_c13_g3_i1.p1 TRINITY_DN67936_c13_g3~~TRINITY_DN67936_c13_g3_i1.p1  ORF type:complete len:222 (+),score=1.65 TRINITY_DN67936_c13_g3_i1:35-700(+)
MLRLLSLSCFLLPCLASVLMEVSFDLALQQESETGYTASHTVSEYIKDTNLLWMRYLNTLVSGTTGNAPMRTAFMEFDSYADWAAFEDKHLERTHVLYDLFWINWKRYLWEGMPESNFHPRERGEDNGGYTYIFRYSVRDGSEADAQKYFDAQNAQLNKVLQENEQFIERRVYKNGPWQDEYQFMVLYEFGSMEALSKYYQPVARRVGVVLCHVTTPPGMS